MLRKMIHRLWQSTIIKGTLILTAAGLVTRVIGFLFRIFLAGKIGAEGLGIYQLIFPVQIICYSICTIGFETAIAKMTAASCHHHRMPSRRYFKYGILLSFFLSLFAACVLYRNAGLISRRILFEPRCYLLLKALAFSVPLASIHACICGYYIGCKNTHVTAISQIIEQLTRVIAIMIIFDQAERAGFHATPLSAVIGSVAGEMIATVFCLLHIIIHHRRHSFIYASKPFSHHVLFLDNHLLKELLSLAVPISLNRLMLSVLQSIQSILIPNLLMRYGYSPEKSLAAYGILLGLVIPFILFPGALINSLSVLLLPAISQADSANNQTVIRNTIEKSFHFCMIFGIFCAAVFYTYGKPIGLHLLSDKKAGTYLCLLGIVCPFIYITSTLASIINGLGKTGITFLFGALSTILQIFAMILLMPLYGVAGYIIGFIGSNFFNAVCLFLYVCKNQHCHISFFTTVIYPVLTSFVVMKGTQWLFSLLFCSVTLPVMIFSLAICCILYTLLMKEEITGLL